MDAVRGLLDELMGKDRNLPAQQRKGSLKFSDPSICKFELCGLCPNSLFKNTRSDLGPCKYEVHADHLDWERIQGDWNKLPDKEKASYGYDKELYRYLDELVRDMDRKVRRAKDRADKENAPKDLTPAEQARLDDLHARMKEALDKSQKAGEDGDVDMSMLLAQQAETLKADYAKLEKQLRTPDRTMTVCEVCGVFINSTDNDQRKLDHLNGKQFLGWKRIREMYAEVTERVAKLPSSTGRDDRERERHRSRSRSRERGELRDRDRDHRGSSRRDRSRSRERDRGSSRRDDRYDRDRYDRDRDHRSSSRRDRERDRY